MGAGKPRKNLILIIVFFALLFFQSNSIKPVHAEPSLTDTFTYLGFTNVTETTVEIFPKGLYEITLYAEFAGYHETNELRHYPVNTSDFTLLFSGSEGNNGYITPPINKTFSSNSTFGLSMYVASENHTYFTESYRNPDGQVHSKVYLNLDKPNMYLIGFENMYGAGDRDYNDMVFSLDLICTNFTLTVSCSVGGTTDPVPDDYVYPCCTNVSVTAVPDVCYEFSHWELDGAPAGSVNPIVVHMDDDHVLHAVFTYSPPPLSVQISPPSASICLGDSVHFSSEIDGGLSPYTYQWYVDSSPVSGESSSTFTFTPPLSGIYYVYLKVTDGCNTVAQSQTAKITAKDCFGGYSASLTSMSPKRQTTTIQIAGYITLIALFGLVLNLIRRKRQ